MEQLMVASYNKRYPEGGITEEEFQAVNDTISGAFDDRFVLGEGAGKMLEALNLRVKKLGL